MAKRINSINDLVNLVEMSAKPLFVRYCRGEAADAKSNYCSRNHQTGEYLSGLSCNPLTVAEWWRNGTQAWIEMQVRDYSYLRYQGGRGTQAWIVSGEEIGRGSDNEPIIRVDEYIGTINNKVVDQC